MNIKSLLLGSAAAMVAVSGAQAADAVVVEPEPVEYVRVCDAYGSGFFYIPGTERCIKFSGYIRSYYGVVHIDNGTSEYGFADWASRARMTVDTRNETDWGTLRGYFRIDTDLRGGDAGAVLDRAMISLAGFRAGVGANYWTTNHGFAGVNLWGVVSDQPGFFTIEDGWYTPDTNSTLFDYTWAADGFSVTVGVESLGGVNRALISGPSHSGYVGFNYSGDGFGFAATAAYDNGAIDNSAGGNRGGWAWKVSADLDLSDFVPGGALHAMYMTDGDYNTGYLGSLGTFTDTESVWQVSAQMDLSDEFVLAAQYSHAEADRGQAGAVAAGEDSGWNAGIGLNWYPAAAPGFQAYASYHFGEINGSGLVAPTATTPANNPGFARGSDLEWTGFTVGVRRNF